VDASLIKWVPYDGMGKRVRNPINFTERGFGVRGAKGSVDRGHSAASQLKPGDFDFDHLFGTLGCRWLHTGGIFAGLSETTAEITIQACEAAKRHGVTVSYDLNYRPSLWQERGGFPAAQALNRQLAPYIDVMIGVLCDEPPVAGAVPQGASDIFAAEDAALRPAIEKLVAEFPNLKTIAATLRRVHTASEVLSKTRRENRLVALCPALPASTGVTASGTSACARNCERAALAFSASSSPLLALPAASSASNLNAGISLG